MEYDINKNIDENAKFQDNILKLRRIAKENDSEINFIKRENKKLLESKNVTLILPIIEKKEKEQEKTEVDKKIKSLDVNYYKEYLSCCDNTSDLDIFMPDIKDNNYQDIIACLMMDIQKDIVFYSNMMNEENDIIILKEIKQKIESLKFMQSLITEYNEDKTCLVNEEIQLGSTNSPILLYAKTAAGNVKLINDLKNEAVESYPEFLRLFDSLVTGNLKNFKVLKNPVFSSCFYEVKLNQCRITFESLLDNYYVVTGAFTKKTTVSHYHYLKLVNANKLFAKNKKYLLENVGNTRFIDDQNDITKEVYKLLRGEK